MVALRWDLSLDGLPPLWPQSYLMKEMQWSDKRIFVLPEKCTDNIIPIQYFVFEENQVKLNRCNSNEKCKVKLPLMQQ